MLAPLHLSPAMVDVKPVATKLGKRLEFISRGVGTLDVAIPKAVSSRQFVVKGADVHFLRGCYWSRGNNDEVAVTCQIPGAQGEGTLKVRANEIVAQFPP